MRRRLHRANVHTSGLDRKLDKPLFILTIFLTIIGLVSVADVSSPQAVASFGDPFYYVKQQTVWATIGIVGMLVASYIPYSFWRKLAPILFFGTVVCLVLVLTPWFGTKVLGARRWLSFGPLSFQPSEVVKLTLSIFFAFLLEREAPFFIYVFILAMLIGLVMLQPDLGTTLVIVAIGICQLFVAGVSLISLGVTGLVGIAGGLVLILTSSYRRARLLSFFEHSNDPLGDSYHIRQVLIALGSGGLWGVGVGQSRQKQLFLPETATDSVFPILAEELGFIGGTVIILLLLYLILRCLKVAKNAPDRFSFLLASGISIWIATQIFLNISSMVALTPLTGIPLPFFSYGGTSLSMILVSIGIVLNISRFSHK